MNIMPGTQFSFDTFRSPRNEFAVTYMWFWNVAINKERVDRELAEYAKAGVESIYIVPLPKDFSPEDLRTFMDPEYLSKEFFDIVEYTLKKCISLGIKPWIYDEGGWPSGGACYNTVRENPKAKLKLIEKREITLMSDKRFYPEEGFIALFNGKHRLPSDYIASRDCTLTAYYVTEAIQRGCRVDYTNRSVTDTFINNTYEKYKECVGDLFGSEIPVIFTDEPGLLRKSVADREFELFEQEFGYDLRDYAYALFDNDGELSEKERRALIDHNILLGKLFKENTFEPIRDWCEKNGVYYSGHLDIDNRPYGGTVKGVFSMLDALRQFHIPGVDVIWEQIRYPHGGRVPLDDETLGMGFFPRLASSAARQTGHTVSVTESLDIYGDGLTHDTIRYVMNYQYIRGINAMNFAPISFGKSRLSALMTRPNFRPEKPGFFNLKHINEYFARLSYLTRLGHAEVDTALYLPCDDFGASPDTLDDASYSFKKLGTSIEEANVAFDIIDDRGIRDATDTGEGLKLGDALYRHFAVPECKYMPEDVKEKIEKYIGIGAPTYDFNNKFLKVMTRKLDTGRLWFIFNEGIEPASEKLTLSGGKHIYRIDIMTGDMYESYAELIDLPSGEIAVYLVTDETYMSDKRQIVCSSEIKGFAESGYDRFNVTYFGINKSSCKDKAPIGDDFSGTVYYEADYELCSEPKDEDTYRIRFEDTATSATILLDGEYAANVGMRPMYANIPAKLLKKHGKITVALSNTAANEVVARRDVNEWFPSAEVGAYIPRMTKFESRLSEIKLGRVFIEKLG